MKLTNLLLQLAERSSTKARGILRDILVKVGNSVIPTNFMILTIKEDNGIPIILGSPFLAIVVAIIDVKNRHISFSYGD